MTGVRVTDWAVHVAKDKLSGAHSGDSPPLPVPILFHPLFKRIPAEVLRLLGVPEVSYDDTDSKYTFNKFVKTHTGLETLKIIHISVLLFVGSIVMVTMAIPNLYFRLMLWLPGR